MKKYLFIYILFFKEGPGRQPQIWLIIIFIMVVRMVASK